GGVPRVACRGWRETGGVPRTFPPWRTDAGPCMSPGRGKPQRGEGLGSAGSERGEGPGAAGRGGGGRPRAAGWGGGGGGAGAGAGGEGWRAANVPPVEVRCRPGRESWAG